MNELLERAPELMQKGGAASAGASGLVAFVGDNASLFTVCFAAIGVAVTVAGYYWRKRIDLARRRDDMARRREEEELMEIARERARREEELHQARMAALAAKSEAS